MSSPSLQALALVLATALLSGCAAAVVGGAAVTASVLHDRRDSETVLMDQSIEFRLRDRMHSTGGPGRGNHIKIVSHNRIVLLAGEVREEEDSRLAETLAEGLPEVRRVVNELAVGAPTGLGRRTRDALLTSQVKSSLLAIDIPGFDPTRVNVLSVRGGVYLMGLVTGEEAEAVTERVRRVSGVRKVVKVFEYTDPDANG